MTSIANTRDAWRMTMRSPCSGRTWDSVTWTSSPKSRRNACKAGCSGSDAASPYQAAADSPDNSYMEVAHETARCTVLGTSRSHDRLDWVDSACDLQPSATRKRLYDRRQCSGAAALRASLATTSG